MIDGNAPRSGSQLFNSAFGHFGGGVRYTENSRCWSFVSRLSPCVFGFPRVFGGRFVTLRESPCVFGFPRVFGGRFVTLREKVFKTDYTAICSTAEVVSTETEDRERVYLCIARLLFICKSTALCMI
jgi:hypothetical protein